LPIVPKANATYGLREDEPIPILELPPAINENGAARNQASRGLAIDKLLTRREAELARFVAAGLSNKQIARRASISEGTVKISSVSRTAPRSPLWLAQTLESWVHDEP